MKDHPLMVHPGITDISWLEPTMILLIGFCFGLLLGVIALHRERQKTYQENTAILEFILKLKR